MVVFDASEGELKHYGTPRHSGRYPWGTSGWGEGPGSGSQRSMSLLDMVAKLKSEGLSEKEIAQGLGMTTTQLRAQKSIAKSEQKAALIAQVQSMRDSGDSVSSIARQLGKNESSIRALLAPGAADKSTQLASTVKMLQEQVDKKQAIDVSKAVEYQAKVSRNTLNNAISVLQDRGYKIQYVRVPQMATGELTSTKVLTKADLPWKTLNDNLGMIQQIDAYSDDGGRTWHGILPPKSIDLKRVDVRYAEDGGAEADGVIYVRPGVPDVSLGGANYAQVRIAVNGTHYIKGMAMYKDDLPPGVDLQFNTNKSKKASKLDALKPMQTTADGKIDLENPFGSTIRRQIGKVGEDGRVAELTSVMNLVNEEGNWDTWANTLSTQMLSKQKPSLAKEQLAKTYEDERAALDEIKALTNPTVKQRLLQSYADGADAKAVHMKAKAIKGQSQHVILPMNSLKPTEIYAPNFKDGERVVLIRHPHGGTFEIPELTVNNRHPEARKLIGTQAKDAVGIHHSVAAKLSGADFDGDTVLVIPNGDGKVKTSPSLEGLKDFDPQRAYPGYEGMKRMTPAQKQKEMGIVSNLITDMSIRGAPPHEMAAAVRHSMVVIDAEKHNLNWKLSEQKNGIANLKAKYQHAYNEDGKGGASTLISRATSTERVPARKPRPASQGGPIDPKTGKLVYVRDESRWGTVKSTKLAETDDAYSLVSGGRKNPTPIEAVYADHSNRMKGLANEARRELVATKPRPYSPSAAKTYRSEVQTLTAKLRLAQQNAPRERAAQRLANVQYKAAQQANPNMDNDDKKKLRHTLLAEARRRTGANKDIIKIEAREWEAIQAGAITHTRLKEILDHADLDVVKELATPRTRKLMTPSKIQRAKAMAASGYTQAEIASALGVSLTTLKEGIK